MSADLYANNVGNIRDKLANLNAERTSNYDTMANNISEKFAGPQGTLAEFQDKWAEVQKLGEGELMGHLVGKGVLKGAKNIYTKYKTFQDAKSAKIQKANIEEMKADPADVPSLMPKKPQPQTRPKISNLDDPQDYGPGSETFADTIKPKATMDDAGDVEGTDTRLFGEDPDDIFTGPQGSTATPSRPSQLDADPVTEDGEQYGFRADLQTTTADPVTTTTTSTPDPTAATQDNPALRLTTDAGGDFDATAAGGMNLTDVASAGRNLGTTVTRIGATADDALDTMTQQASGLGSRMVGSIKQAGTDAYNALQQSGSKGYLKQAITKVGKFIKGGATDAAEGAAETGGELATELTGTDALLGAVPVVGEVALAVSGVVALGEGIYHLFHKPEAPPPPKLIAPVQAPTALLAKYAAALPSSDNSLDRGASSVSF
jgi:hypothetical protein